jgi:hypothetical protein
MMDLDQSALDDLSRGRCPMCLYRGFVIGPQGGRSINIECANVACRDRFNATFVAGTALFAQHIGNGKEGPAWPSEPRN